MSVTFTDLERIKSAQEKILNPSTFQGWMVVGYNGSYSPSYSLCRSRILSFVLIQVPPRLLWRPQELEVWNRL